MRVFVDTSAWLAVLDRDDQRHALARRIWAALLEGRHELVTSSYVLVETLALIQRRLGMEAFRVFHTDIHPLVDVIWVEGELHRSAAEQVLTANQRRLSLVDCSSFVVLKLARRISSSPSTATSTSEAIPAYPRHASRGPPRAEPEPRPPRRP